MVQKATSRDSTAKKLMKTITDGYAGAAEELKPFRKIFHELTAANGVILKGEKLFIPDSELSPGSGNLRQQ